MTMDEKFRHYHQQNPRVYKLFRWYAFQAKRIGGKKCFGAKAIMERVRWEMNVDTTDEHGFKINNNYTSRYVRMLIAEHPEFESFFELRTLRAA